MWIYVVLIVAILILVLVFVTYNNFVKLNNRVNEAFSTMDVYLKKRWDLIPNIVETVKGYAKHESETLEKIIELRNKKYDNMSDDEKITTNNQINENISKIMLLAESYPKLKASENFIDLSKQLSKVEDEIANSRKYYNGTVRNFNNKVEMFPSSIIANLFGYKAKKMFEIEDNQRQNVNVEL